MSVIVFIFLSLLATCTSGLVLDLIPRNIIYPPTYPPNSTLHQRIDLALSRLRTQKTSCSEKRGKLPLSSDDGYVYYVKFTIGSKKVPIVASLDTGSHFLWIDCKVPHPVPPPKVPKKRTPHYDPNDSASYKPSTCPSSYCNKVHGGGCDNKNRCKYNVCFGDKSYSKGFMGFENITYKSPAPGSQDLEIKNVLFGCGTDTMNKNENEDGVFGIGGKELSVLNQTGNKLSYCLGDINDAAPYSSHLALGKDAQFLGEYVKVELKNDAYVLELEEIFFGKKDKISMPKMRVQVDTGSTLTFLSRDIFLKIRSKVEKIIGPKTHRIILSTGSTPDDLCYALDPPLMTDFPNVTLRFHSLRITHQRTDLVLDIKGMFVKIPDEKAYCLAFESSDEVNIIGAVNMQHHNIGFDLDRERAYFQKVRKCNPIQIE